MEHLHPEVILAKTDIPHDSARASVTLRSSRAGSYEEFEALLIAYVSHHTEKIYGMAYPPDLCLSIARKHLDQAVGFDNAAYIALSGSEGGMHTLLNHISDGFKQEAKQAYYNWILDSFVSPLNFEQIVEVMREFKERLIGYSPASMRFISPEQMAGSYKNILWRHIDSLSRNRNLWDYR
jgi:hypothetical protein